MIRLLALIIAFAVVYSRARPVSISREREKHTENNSLESPVSIPAEI